MQTEKDKLSLLVAAATAVCERFKLFVPHHVYEDCECDMCMKVKALEHILRSKDKEDCDAK